MSSHIARSLLAVLTATSLAQAGTSLHNPTQLQSLSEAGVASVTSLADLDGDGLPELVVGQPGAAGGGADAGLVSVRSSIDDTLLWSVDGAFAGQQLGHALASLPDLDGDGHQELLVGAPARLAAGQPGSVQVRSGADGALLYEVSGPQQDAAFGHAVAALPDVDGDGVPDLLVGSPLHDVGAAVDAGRVVVLSGSDGSDVSQALGSDAGDQLGDTLLVVIDGVFGNSHDPDIVIGATAGGDDDQGAVQWRGASDLALWREVPGGATDKRFGAQLACLGDIDGDGASDVAVAATPLDPQGAPVDIGSVSLLSGATGASLARVQGATGDGFGSSLASLGDITGDGLCELAVGAPAAALNGGGSGSVRVLDGADLSSLHVMAGSAGTGLGHGLAALPDRDGDGLRELAVAEPGAASLHVLSFSRFATAAGGVAGTNGVPKLSAQGTLAAGTPLGVSLSSARTQSAAALIWGNALTLEPFSDTWVPLVVEANEGLVTDGFGKTVLESTWPEGIPAGTTVYFQYQVVDPQALGGLARSNVIAGLTQ